MTHIMASNRPARNLPDCYDWTAPLLRCYHAFTSLLLHQPTTFSRLALGICFHIADNSQQLIGTYIRFYPVLWTYASTKQLRFYSCRYSVHNVNYTQYAPSSQPTCSSSLQVFPHPLLPNALGYSLQHSSTARIFSHKISVLRCRNSQRIAW